MKAELAQERDKVEREIAAWLRALGSNIPDETFSVHPLHMLRALADRIERGDHRGDCAPEEPPAGDPYDEVLVHGGAVIKLRYELLGNHVHADLFVGPRADALALSGHLVMRVPEWQAFEGALVLGAPRVQWCRVVVITEGRRPPP